jgi:hypothetical protein
MDASGVAPYWPAVIAIFVLAVLLLIFLDLKDR